MLPTNSNKKRTSATPKGVADIVAHRSQQQIQKTPMLTADVIPAGTYRSRVLAVKDASNDEGKPMADVTYSFETYNGKTTAARVRYPIVGYHIQRLVDALIDAGLPEGAPLTEAVGIEEEVTIVYPQEGSLGKIKNRRPVDLVKVEKKPLKKAPASLAKTSRDEDANDAENFDDEFDDFLEEDLE